MDNIYKSKYLKYKEKYLKLKAQIGSAPPKPKDAFGNELELLKKSGDLLSYLTKNMAILDLQSVTKSKKSQYILSYIRNKSTKKNAREIRNDFDAVLTRYNEFEKVTGEKIPTDIIKKGLNEILKFLLNFKKKGLKDGQEAGSMFLDIDSQDGGCKRYCYYDSS